MGDHTPFQSGSWGLNDQNRQYLDPVPIVYGNLITPNTCISARVHDIANRRWYEVNVAKDIRDEDWITDTLSSYIKIAREPFNVITIDEDGLAIWSTRDPRTVGIQVAQVLKFAYTGSVFPRITTEEVLEKRFLAGSVDSCTWNGQRCVYKQILFEEDIPRLRREISVRERLIERAGLVSESQMSMFGISPILAVVINRETSLTEGLIMPYGGFSLDHFAYEVDSTSVINPRVTLRHLSAIIGAVSYLSGFSVLHGDICERNVCVKGIVAGVESPIMIVDFGETAPEYKGDKQATGELLFWCARNLGCWSEDEREKITGAGRLLKDDGEFSTAVEKLEG